MTYVASIIVSAMLLAFALNMIVRTLAGSRQAILAALSGGGPHDVMTAPTRRRERRVTRVARLTPKLRAAA